jgi:ankyrin repeat protein
MIESLPLLPVDSPAALPCDEQKAQAALADWLARHDFPGPHARTAHGRTALMQAAWLGDDAIVGALLRAGVGADVQDDSGNTALWYACLYGGPATIARLVHAGALLDHCNDEGISCLMQATASGQLEVAQLLLKLGAAWDPCAPDGRDALEMAADRGLELLRLARLKTSH